MATGMELLVSNKRSAWAGFRDTPWWVQLICWVVFLPAPAIAWAWKRGSTRYVIAGVGTLVYVIMMFSASRDATHESEDLPTTASTAPEAAVIAPESEASNIADTSSTTESTTTTVPETTTSTSPPTTTTVPPATTPPPNVFAPLQALTIREESTMNGYSRDLFPHWIDANNNRCHTRCEVLLREALPAGGWLSIYDNVMVYDASDLDVDHVVPLAEAWRSGAADWETDRRAAFANDLDEPWALKAVTASSNRSKSDSDPADWRPRNQDIWCEYAQGWIAVKLKWNLSADTRERDALGQMLETCA